MRPPTRYAWILILLFFWFFPGFAPAEPVLQVRGQTVYVPVYSHIYTGNREAKFLLAATLSIRNTDPDHPITISGVTYYDGNGKPVRSYTEKPFALGALSTRKFVIQESDTEGGSGASFIVRWTSGPPVAAPIVETVMIGTQMQQGISFVSRGKAVRETP